MDRQQIDQWCEKGILVLLLSILVFGPLATGAVRTLEILIIQGLTVGIAVLWLVRLWNNSNYRLIWPPICWVVLGFVGYAAVRYLQAPIEYVAREELIRILIYACLFFTVLNNVQKQESINWVVCALLTAGVFSSLYAIYQFVTNTNMVWHFVRPEQYNGRGSGTYICPNHLAGFLEMILPLGLAYTLIGRLGHLTKVFLGYASVVILAGIGVTISRGGWIATGVALAAFFAWLLRRAELRKPAWAVLLLLLVAAGGFVIKSRSSHERFQQMFSGGKLDDVRFRLWKPAVQMWREDIWLGIGPAHFDYRFRAYRPEEVQMRPNRTHNDYLNTLTDWGAFGLALVLGALALLGVGVIRTWKYVQRGADLGGRNSNRSAFFVGASIGLLGILVHSVVDFNMHIPANAIVAITFMALLSNHWRFATESYWRQPGRGGALCGSVLILPGLVFLLGQEIRRGREYLHLEAALDTKEFSSEEIAALKLAYAVEPNNFETTYRIGEGLRQESWQGNIGFEKLALEAMAWFERGMQLNPYDPYNYLRYGMCLLRLGRQERAAKYFHKVQQLDPNGYYAVAHQGWYHFELGDWQKAKDYFERSLRLKPADNEIASRYLQIVHRRLQERPSNAASSP